MPYIKKNLRIKMDKIIKLMKELKINAKGDLNYVLFAFCKRHVLPSYNNYKNYCAELRQCATEIERKILAPYEDIKESENGTI